jgi:hypothetical protein
MSQENIDLARRALAEFAVSPTGVKDAARAGLIAPDAEFDFSALYPDGPIIRGLEAWREWADALPWGGSLKLEPERFFDIDDERVLVLMHVTAAGEGSGVPVERRSAHEYTIRDGSSCASRCTRSGRKPSKPPGFRSRRSRSRARKCDAISRRSLALRTFLLLGTLRQRLLRGHLGVPVCRVLRSLSAVHLQGHNSRS